MVAEPLLISFETVRKRLNADIHMRDHDDATGDLEHHVVQLGPKRAAVWLSQTFNYAVGDETSIRHNYRVTRFAPLVRENGEWQIGKIVEIENVAVKSVVDNHAGQVVGVLERNQEMALALLNPLTLEWVEQGAVPTAFGPLPGVTIQKASLQVGRGVVVVDVSSTHHVPRWVYWWGNEPAYTDGSGVFYSKDWGRSWDRLSIKSAAGILGMDRANDRVVWVTGNGFDGDTAVRSFGLN
ncbi:MAG: hypothetical protein ABIN96_14790 [Rubrivivax sp.]